VRGWRGNAIAHCHCCAGTGTIRNAPTHYIKDELHETWLLLYAYVTVGLNMRHATMRTGSTAFPCHSKTEIMGKYKILMMFLDQNLTLLRMVHLVFLVVESCMLKMEVLNAGSASVNNLIHSPVHNMWLTAKASAPFERAWNFGPGTTFSFYFTAISALEERTYIVIHSIQTGMHAYMHAVHTSKQQVCIHMHAVHTSKP
jgi:hypothetical protein